ncbi:MAG TPA: hypothetical protein VFD60_03080 [Nitrososphaeraceae archaeon]|jgi:hypothetical protein|nr:hypothetical protein [Nitrososphaeraceae archaeon]
MVNIYQIIVNKYIIADIKCHKLVSKDGITTQDLVIDKVGGLFEGIQVNTKTERSSLPSIGISLGIMKNLDQYQYIVCSEIRSIPDANPYKNELQKYRIAIIASFAKLVPILQSRSDKDLKNWNYFAQILLTQISELLVKERTNPNKYGKSDSDSAPFDYFDVPEKEVDNILQSIY